MSQKLQKPKASILRKDISFSRKEAKQLFDEAIIKEILKI
jgi:hypothetical protein